MTTCGSATGRANSGQVTACGSATDLHVVDGELQTRRRRSSLVTRSSADRCDRNRRGRLTMASASVSPGSAIPAALSLLPHAPEICATIRLPIHARWCFAPRQSPMRASPSRWRSRQRRVSCAFALRRLIGWRHCNRWRWQEARLYGFGAQLISSRKSRFGRGDPYLPSPDLETSPPKPSPEARALGQVAPTSCRLSNSMRRSSSRPLGLVPWRSSICKGGRVVAPAFI